MSHLKIAPGFNWIHVVDENGRRAVFLGNFNAFTQGLSLVEPGLAEAVYHDGMIGPWRVTATEPVVRPDPRIVGYRVGPNHEPLTVAVTGDGWVDANTRQPCAPGTAIYHDMQFTRQIHQV